MEFSVTTIATSRPARADFSHRGGAYAFATMEAELGCEFNSNSNDTLVRLENVLQSVTILGVDAPRAHY
jgi:hypothetical protein